MTFANPALLLAGLLCIGFPILIHILMRRRRRPVAWGAMDWLMQAYRQQRRRMRFEQLLLLALRCLLIALVAFALGKPLLGARSGSSSARPKTLAIVLDTSLASQATSPVGAAGAGESALERQKQAALALLDQLDSARGDRAALVLLSSPARSIVNPASSDIIEVKRLVAEVRATDARADIHGAMEMVLGLSKEDRHTGGGPRDVVVALLSDLREGSVDVSTPWPASNSLASGSADPLRVVTTGPAQEPLANVAITSVEPLSSLVLGTATDATGGGSTTVALRIGLARWGNNAEQTTTVRAWLSDAARLTAGSAPLLAPANVSRAEVSWTQGQREASVTISAALPALASALSGSATETSELLAIAQVDQDAIAGDNVLGRPLEARSVLNVALLGPGSDGTALDRFTPRDWLGLALWPEQNGVLSAASASMRTTRIEARDFVGAFGGSADPLAVPGVLRGMAAIAITEPQLLDASGWRSLRAASASGAMIMVMPPEGEQAQTWTDAMREALGLPWQLARNSREVAPDQSAIAPEAPAQGDDDLLNVLRPELEELTRSVRVSRILGVEAGLSNAHVLLSLRDGSPMLIAARATIAGAKAGPAADPTAGTASTSAVTAGAGGGGGWVVVWLVAPSLAWTDLPAKPLMVPLLQELVRQGVGRSAPRRDVEAGVLASAVAWGRLRGSSDVVELVLGQAWSGASQGEADTLVSLDRAGAGAVRKAGLWRARDASGAAIPSGAIAVNAARGAGNTTPIAKEQIERWILGWAGAGSSGGGGIGSGEADAQALTFLTAAGTSPRGLSAQAGKQSVLEAGLQAGSRDGDGWKWSFWLLIGAAGIALVEAMLARWFSHARMDAGSGQSTIQASGKPGAGARA